MKTSINRYLLKTSLLLTLLLCLTIEGCKKNTDVSPDLISPTDAPKVGAALILPAGSTTQTGTPPAPSTSTQAPRVTSNVTEQPTTNGGVENVDVPYSNLNGGIGGVYAQVEGAPTYYTIPVSGNAPVAGTVSFPIGIPANLNSGSFTMVYCIYDRSGRVSNVLRIRFTVRRVEPPKAGEGVVNIGGQTLNATAVCDLDFAPYGRGYAIQISSSQFIIFYNMRQGTNQLGNFENLSNNSSGIPTAPFALYYNTNSNSTIYGSISGTATASGKALSSSVVFKDILSNARLTINASGNCR